MKIAILTPGILPVPAASGGAVENLIEELLVENINDDDIDITLFGVSNREAVVSARERFKYVKFNFYTASFLSKGLDKVCYEILKKIKSKGNVISYRYIFERISIIKQYKKKLSLDTFDKVILVSNSTLFFLFMNKAIKRKYLNKTVLYLHNEIKTMYHLEYLLSSLNSVWGISKFVLDKVYKKYPELKDVPSHVIKNAVDVNLFRKVDLKNAENLRVKFDISESDFVVLFSGRLVKEKGPDILLKSLQYTNIKRLKVFIVGGTFYSSDVDSNYTLKLRKLADICHNNVIFTGYVPYSQMPLYYRIANIVCLPSVWDEPAGMTMLEAAVTGRPLITTNVGGIPEYVSGDKVTVLDLKNIVKCMGRAIDKIYKNYDDVEKQSVSYGNEVSKHSSRNAYYSRFRELLLKREM